MGLKIIQITSIPLQVTKDQMYTMFRCIGEIEDIRLYPTVRALATPFNSRICFVKFKNSSCGETACYLNNTQMMDHTLQVNPYADDDKEKIPNEDLALEILAAITNRNNSKCAYKEEEHLKEADNKIDSLLKENGLPPFPLLPNHYNHANIEQIRRTLVVTNLSLSLSGQQVVDHFSKAAEVKYVRFCQRNDDTEVYALVEFTNQEGIIPGLKLNNTEIVDGRQIKVYHSVMAIEKQPEEKLNKLMQCAISDSVLFEEDYAVILGQALKSECSSQSSAASCQSHSSAVHSGDTRSNQNGKSRSRNPSSSKSEHRNRSTSQNNSRSRNRNRSNSRNRSRSRKRNTSRSRKQNRSMSRKRNRSTSRKRNRSTSRKRNRSTSRKRNRSTSRKRNRSRSRNRKRSRSRNRNRSLSRNRQRLRHRHRSNSRNRTESKRNRRSKSRCQYSSRSKRLHRSKPKFQSNSKQENSEKSERQTRSKSLESSTSQSQS